MIEYIALIEFLTTPKLFSGVFSPPSVQQSEHRVESFEECVEFVRIRRDELGNAFVIGTCIKADDK